jgi:hypothetical protein
MASLSEVRLRLLDLHKALVEAERRDYERLHGRQSDTDFLEVLVKDPNLSWLGALTALMVRLDEALEDGEALEEGWIEEIRKLLTLTVASGEFNPKYRQLTQLVPEVLVAHGAVMQALR